jgi:hypothetical protein
LAFERGLRIFFRGIFQRLRGRLRIGWLQLLRVLRESRCCHSQAGSQTANDLPPRKLIIFFFATHGISCSAIFCFEICGM